MSTPTPNAVELADKLMEQAQVFASAWSIAGGRFDMGDGFDVAEAEKASLRVMIEAALAQQVPEPTPAMCRAAVEYLNGPDVYSKVPREALAIEEGIYASVWRAMKAAAPPAAQQVPAVPEGWQHVAYAENGVLQWMTGRKFQNVELYAPAAPLPTPEKPA